VDAAAPGRQWCAHCGVEAFSYDALCWRCGGRLTTQRPHSRRRRHGHENGNGDHGSDGAAALEPIPRRLGARQTPARDEAADGPTDALRQVARVGWLVVLALALLAIALLVTHHHVVEGLFH